MDFSGDLLARLFSPQSLWIALWVGLAVFTCLLIGLLHTRLGASKPLQKCTILAVWFHLLLLIYATSIQVVAERPGGGNQVTINLSAGGTTNKPAKTSNLDKPRVKELPSTMTASSAKLPAPTTPAPRVDASLKSAPRPVVKPAPKVADLPVPTPIVRDMATAKSQAMVPAAMDIPKPNTTAKQAETAPRVAKLSPPKLDVPKPIAVAPPKLAQPAEMKPAELKNLPKPTVPPPVAAKPAVPLPTTRAVAPSPLDVAVASTPAMVPLSQLPPAAAPAPLPTATATLKPLDPATADRIIPRPPDFHTPELYAQRLATDKEKIAESHGGSSKTEASVKLALKWLAANQEPDGRWNPRRFGAGQENEALGHNRGGAGAKADAGITGLALLALLGAGHTHERGDYKPTVERALQFLIDAQHPNGNLGGEAEPFAFMYCHGMASLALSEALAMTGDERLKDPVRRAISYTIGAQNRTTGGWRYRPQESGDLSQLGWQLMALKSASLGGIETPPATRDGMIRFLQGVSSGKHGGLASYRAGERVSCPMTAEGLMCRQFLGIPRQNPACDEAGDFILGELPGTGAPNYYYWYYGTLSMYQLQGPHWQRWNDALTHQLIRTQIDRGEDAGSWNADDVWGSYGGRVYSTALSTLCLEVYYRYLPLYVEAAANGGDTIRK